VFAGLTFGVSNVVAHPAFTGSCQILKRNKSGEDLTLKFDTPACSSQPGVPCLEEIDFNATPLGLPGEITLTCRADNLGVGTGTTILNFANTGDTCDLGLGPLPENAPIAKTQNWQEVITASGEATLTCVFPPH
jgi:hypothetical protein